ncbi:RNA helicase [Ranunculus cassubicifolius]
METTETSGPRYAPDDPTLPQPWKRLIHGQLSYYWNPETNVTQYQRPASPKLPPSIQSNGCLPQPTSQPPGSQLQELMPQPKDSQVAQQNGVQFPHQGSQIPQSMQQQMFQYPAQQVPHPQGQHAPQYFGQQMSFQQGHHFNQQQLPYQQTTYQQVPQISHQQSQPFTHQPAQHYAPHQGQQYPQHVHNSGSSQRDDPDFPPGNNNGTSLSQAQPTGASSFHSTPPVTHSIQMAQVGSQSFQPQQSVSSSINFSQTGSSWGQLSRTGNDSIHQQQMSGTLRQNQVGQLDHNHHSSGNLNEEDLRGRTGNDIYFNASKERPVMLPQQPMLPSGPLNWNQQEIRMGGVPPQNLPPSHSGGMHMAAGPTMLNMYNHGGGGKQFSSNNTPTRPSTRLHPSSDTTNFSAAVDAYRRQHEVTATGDSIPAPFMTFEATGFPPEILREMKIAGFSIPTPIQAQTWPIALQSRDIVAIAKTGSGKTLGYLIPAFIHLISCRNNPQNGRPTVVVLAPTRELATQIQDEAIKFGRSSSFSCTCLYGGAPKGPQIQELDRGADIVVATPGRLNDILKMRKIDFRQVSLLVLDEADRMLDMGFEPQIRKIVNEIPPRRQTLMYTATWPKEVRKIAGDLLVNPVQVNIGRVNELAANNAITQYVEVIPEMHRQRRLEQILRSQERGSKIIIFCSTKRLCDQLARSIGRTFGAAAIHGDKSQGERDYVLNQFRSGKSPILVATDVAARGLDIKDIRVVINYDFPTGIEDYVHRIGRTGRAGATGIAYTFFSDQDWKYAADLVKLLEGANQQVPPQLLEMAMRGRGRGGGMNRWGHENRGGDGDGGFGDRGGGFGGRGRGRGDRIGGDRGGELNCGFRGNRDGGFGGGGGGDRFGSERDSGRRDGGFGGRWGIRGRGGFAGPGGWDRHERGGPIDRHRVGRYDGQRASRSRRRSYSRSPEKVRTWRYSSSPSRSRSRSRSWTRSRSRSRSYSRGRGGSRSRDRFESSKNADMAAPSKGTGEGVPLEEKMSPMSPGNTVGGPINGVEQAPPPPLESIGSEVAAITELN